MTTLDVTDFFYKAVTPAGAAFVVATPDMALQVPAASIKMICETGAVDFSFDGKNVHGTIKPTDGPMDFKGISKNKMWFRTSASGTVRLWAWI